MAVGDKPALAQFGPWKLNELPAPGTRDELEDAWNVDLEDGFVKRRRGRRIALERARLRLSAFVYVTGGAATDQTDTVGDGDLTTRATPLAVNDYYLVGLPFPFTRLEWILAALGAAASTTVAYQYWNGFAWSAVSIQLDGTGALASSGPVEWTLPANWVPGGPDATLGLDMDLFWLKAKNTGANPIVNTPPAEVTSALQTAHGTDLRTEVNGLFEHVRRSGDRRMIVAMDAPGRFGAARFQGQPPVARLFEVDWSRRWLVPIRLPQGARGSVVGARWQFVVWDEWLLASNGYGPVIRYDGSTCTTLEAVNGVDAQQLEAGTAASGRAYLPSVPRARFMAVFRTQLALAGMEEGPDTIVLSEFDNDSNIVPQDAPAHGANVWPADYTFDARTISGDPITGIATVNDRLAVLKKHAVFVYDDGGLRSVTTRYGCYAPGSLASTAEGCFFLSRRGVCFFDGANVRVISAPVDRTLRELVNWTAAAKGAVGELYQRRNEYHLALPVNGQQQSAIRLVYNYKTGVWTKHCGTAPPWMSDAAQTGQPLQIAAMAAIQELRTDEALVTGDYDGNLWIEDAGDDDGGLAFWSFIAFPKIGWTDETLETWRDLRLESLLDAEPFNLYVLPETMDWRGRVADGVSPDGTVAPLLADQPLYETPPAFPVAWGAAAASRRFGMTPLGIQQTASNLQVGLLTKGLYPHRWEIRGIEVAADPRPRRR